MNTLTALSIYLKYRHKEYAAGLIDELCRKESGIMRAETVLRRVSRNEEQWAQQLFREKAAMDYRAGSADKRTSPGLLSSLCPRASLPCAPVVDPDLFVEPLALALCFHIGDVVEGRVDQAAIKGIHGLQENGRPVFPHPVGHRVG